MSKKGISALILLILFVQSFTLQVDASDRNLTLDFVRKQSIEESNGVSSAKIEKIKKQIELKQAEDAIRDIRKKESTVEFSLLFNIKFPDKHYMPKEIELLTKIPEIQNELEILNKQLVYESLKSQTEGEIAYYDVILAINETDFLNQRVEDSQKVFENVAQQYKIGSGKKSDVDYMENQLKGYEKEAEKAILTLDLKKQTLGTKINKDVRLGYSFQKELTDLNITREMLPEIIAYSKENDFLLYQTIQSRRLSEKEVETVLEIYKSKYGSYISDIESYIRNHEGKTIDYNDFIFRYNHTLTQIDSPWYGDYVINLIFFKIYIPKEWFKGKYSGLRYMDDQKYALFVSLVERDKARKAEAEAINALEESINQSYAILKQMEMGVKELKGNLESSEKVYASLLHENRMGLVDFSTLEASRASMYQQQRALFELQADYSKTLSNFNLNTGGYVNKLLGKAETVEEDYSAGSSVIGEASWSIKTNITDFNFVFGVKIPEDFGVNYFQLFYDGSSVGPKVSIEKELVHEAILFGSTEKLVVKFYEEDALKYISELEGTYYQGIFQMKKADGSYEKEIERNLNNEGHWMLEDVDSLRQKFSITPLPSYEYDSFQVLMDTSVIAEKRKGDSLISLKLYFNPISKISVKLMKSGVEVKTLYCTQQPDAAKTLTDKRQEVAE